MDLKTFPDPLIDIDKAEQSGRENIVLAGGCFWCAEAVYRQLDGVSDVVSGYAGGTAETADYETVCTGTTDHAEASDHLRPGEDHLRADPQGLLLRSPTTRRSSTARATTSAGSTAPRSSTRTSDERDVAAEAYIKQLDRGEGRSRGRSSRRSSRSSEFYEAEAYHQDYAARNPTQPYIAAIAAPKVEKVRSRVPEKLKSG